ncbi:unnamed protein product [Nezara viridula]|uniref:Uncharacterized protein n=1 Tax=Nezara viridula TaxID=85310 RepID=A0A9P0HC65_NEZVI|nr:unnamed protein product [Nezara viridula]
MYPRQSRSGGSGVEAGPVSPSPLAWKHAPRSSLRSRVSIGHRFLYQATLQAAYVLPIVPFTLTLPILRGHPSNGMTEGPQHFPWSIELRNGGRNRTAFSSHPLQPGKDVSSSK